MSTFTEFQRKALNELSNRAGTLNSRHYDGDHVSPSYTMGYIWEAVEKALEDAYELGFDAGLRKGAMLNMMSQVEQDYPPVPPSIPAIRITEADLMRPDGDDG
jgi:hypothetical protein